MITAHRLWASLLVGEAKQKSLKIYEAGDAHEVLITLFNDQPGSQDSTAEPAGWSVSVTYKVSPDQVLFQRTFATEKEATDAFGDIVNAAAEAESLIRQEKFEEAAKATENFLNKMKSNSSEQPIELNSGLRVQAMEKDGPDTDARYLYGTELCKQATVEASALFPNYNDVMDYDHDRVIEYTVSKLVAANPQVFGGSPEYKKEILDHLMVMISASIS